ncbi:MAG: TetR/AcrR family transcriptional regulator [Candidatus Cloacimonetes bacterium]|nr:TetR/AcrR family transcriptional regulator [Candidatus Cloacimonadota bacterium]
MKRKTNKLTAKKMDKRLRIINAAMNVFGEKGFHKTKIIDIARSARVADGTIYLYFHNKDDLFIAAFEELIEEKLQNLKKIIAAIDDKLERLLKFFSLHIEMFTQNPNIARFVTKELRQSSEFYLKYPTFRPLQEYINYLKKLCQDAIDASLIRSIDTEVLVIIMIGTLNFALFEWSLGNSNRSLEDIKEQAVNIIYRGLKKGPAPENTEDE